MSAFSVFHLLYHIYGQSNDIIMKKDESIMFKLDRELYLLFKEYCEKKRTSMSHEMRQLILTTIEKKYE